MIRHSMMEIYCEEIKKNCFSLRNLHIKDLSGTDEEVLDEVSCNESNACKCGYFLPNCPTLLHFLEIDS